MQFDFRTRKITIPLAIVAASFLAGCGVNKFEKEVETETVAVKLSREVQNGDYDLVTTEELKKLLDEKKSMVLVDAMPADSFNKEHIAGAKQFLFPKTELDEWKTSETAEKSKDDYEKLLGDNKDALIVVYCGFVKCARSHNAALWARRLGFQNVKRYAGGIYAWKGAKHKTESSKK